MPVANKIPGFTADVGIHNVRTYCHTPVGRGAKQPAVVEPALPPGVECYTVNGMRECLFSTAYLSCVCWNDGRGWNCQCAPHP